MPDLYSSGGEKKNTDHHKATVTEQKPIPEMEVKPEQDEKVDKKAEVKKHIDEVLKRIGEVPRKELGGAFTIYPRTTFIQEQHDEEVVLLLRAHPIVNLKWLALVVGALLIPELLIAAGALRDLPLRMIFVGRVMWYLMMLGYSFEKFLNWYYTVFIVTNERIIDIDFVNLLYRVMSYANLNHIEEPAMISGGFIRSFFKYGDVHISTAADNPTVEGRAVPHPDKVIRIISELSEDLEKRRERGQ